MTNDKANKYGISIFEDSTLRSAITIPLSSIDIHTLLKGSSFTQQKLSLVLAAKLPISKNFFSKGWLSAVEGVASRAKTIPFYVIGSLQNILLTEVDFAFIPFLLLFIHVKNSCSYHQVWIWFINLTNLLFYLLLFLVSITTLTTSSATTPLWLF